MSSVSIICEYNPFHNGHLHQLNLAKKETNSEFTICIMSGNITQRGEMAVCDKFERAKSACIMGADLVLELPFYYACNTAELFAHGAISTLNALGISDYLSFGSEEGDLKPLKDISMLLQNETTTYKANLAKELLKGISYPKAQSQALSKTYGVDEGFLKSPNNILAIEYVKALAKTKSAIIPHTVKRFKVNHLDSLPVDNFASGTAIREYMKAEKQYLEFIPQKIHKIYQNIKLPDINTLSSALTVLLNNMDSVSLQKIYGMTEGIENRMIKMAGKTIEEFAMEIKTKRYTLAHIQRLIIYALTNFTKDIDITSPKYVRILAMNDKGKKLIKKAKITSTIKVITKPNDFLKSATPHEKQLFELDMRATDLYYLAKGEFKKNYDLTATPIVL